MNYFFKNKLINIDFWAKLISTGFYIGYAPVAPGTCGSLLVLALYFLLIFFYSAFCLLPFAYIIYSFLLIILFFLGVWSASHCESFWGRDPGKVVIDEIAGMFITFGFIPVNFKTLWIGFFIFRAFDIIKPPPIRRLEKLPGGWGIMADDMLAGVYANIVLRLLIYFFPLLMLRNNI